MPRADGPDLRAAYRAAWADRRTTGDDSDAVLIRRLRLEGIDLGPDAEARVLAVWRRAVPPRRLLWTLAGDALAPMVSAAWTIYQAFRDGPRTATFEQIASADELDAAVREFLGDSAEHCLELHGFGLTTDAEADGTSESWVIACLAGHRIARVEVQDDELPRLLHPGDDDPRLEVSVIFAGVDGRFQLDGAYVGARHM